MILEYMNERYPDIQPDQTMVDLYLTHMDNEQADILTILNEGFCVFTLRGDSAIIWDIYVRPEKRRSKTASRLADEVTRRAKEIGCRTLIGFSEHGGGGDHTLGQNACTGYGMTKAYDENTREVYVKGI